MAGRNIETGIDERYKFTGKESAKKMADKRRRGNRLWLFCLSGVVNVFDGDGVLVITTTNSVGACPASFCGGIVLTR